MAKKSKVIQGVPDNVVMNVDSPAPTVEVVYDLVVTPDEGLTEAEWAELGKQLVKLYVYVPNKHHSYVELVNHGYGSKYLSDVIKDEALLVKVTQFLKG